MTRERDGPKIERKHEWFAGRWLGIEDSNLGFLSQSQASYHWTNPQRPSALSHAAAGGLSGAICAR